MKCPKCSYLGFDTGDRCRNCGYDFSLIAPVGGADIDLRLDSAPASTTPVPDILLPLFSPHGFADDEPLIKLPATPRPPLAVRKTPDSPRLRAVPKSAARAAAEPVLQFAEAPPVEEPTPAPSPSPRPSPPRRAPVTGEPSSAGDRLAAAALDHVVLGGIDLAVVYLTLRIAELTMDDWLTLPLAPLAAFLVLLKVAYFCAFTAIGGQTIGKMAMGLRVVTDEGERLDGASAVRRTLAGAVSTAALGLGFLPALIGSERRALHDRLTKTRVVDLRSI
jgi:uncharacterized RDD family membrane protein YckC